MLAIMKNNRQTAAGGNRNVIEARRNKNDEFYTQRKDVEDELYHYKHHFAGMKIYCNCDDPKVSEFFRYFYKRFESLQLQQLTGVCYRNMDADIFTPVSGNDKYNGKATYVVCDGRRRSDDGRITKLTRCFKTGDGDFRHPESIALLKDADIVVTNPPFSLFREYVAQLIQYDKKFIILGNINAIPKVGMFPLIRDGKVWLGADPTMGKWYQLPDRYKEYHEMRDGKKYAFVSNTVWFTNLDHVRLHTEYPLRYSYYDDPSKYPKYDNYDAIEVKPANRIPFDYEGVMGVPITFMVHLSPDQFEIVGNAIGNLYREIGGRGLSAEFVKNYYANGGTGVYHEGHPVVGYYDKNGKAKIPYARILIRNKKVEK